MSRILCTVWPFTGHLHPNFAVAAELRRLGHEVAFFTGAGGRDAVTRAGFEFLPMQHINEARVEHLVLSENGILSATGNYLRLSSMWREWVLDSIPAQMQDLLPLIEKWKPDVIVCDPTMWAPFLLLHEVTGIPVGILSLIPACHISGKHGPIIGFPIPRPVTPLQKTKAAVLRAISDVGRRSVRNKANELRQSYGLPPISVSVTDYAGQMPLYLVPGSREFDYERTDLPPSVQYVGPCLWGGSSADAPPEWFNQLPPDQPVIYASEGTIHLQPRLLRAVAQAMAGRPVQVIMTTGKHRDPASIDLGLSRPASNIHVHQWISLNALLPRLAGIVTIGGPSTLMAGFAAGIPAVVVPFTWDHPETGFRVAESGAGVHLKFRDCSPENMRRAIEQILYQPGYRENARRLARCFERDGGPAAAGHLIAGLVRSGTQRSTATSIG
jgi:MGT family glycosyltransferase